MPEPLDPPTPPRPARPARPRRAKKFVLPEHHHDEQEDERTAEHIEAFLDGPLGQTPRQQTRQQQGPERVRRPLTLDTRQDWVAALRRESARHARYGRPASVVLLEIRGRPVSRALDRIAGVLGEVICGQGRETDRAVRIDAVGFRLLLPETGVRPARSMAERIDRAFTKSFDGQPEGVELCVEIATAQRTRTLDDALAEAEARLSTRARSD